MDTDPVSFKEFDEYLCDLERINVLTLAYRPTLLWLRRYVAAVEEVGAREEFEVRSSLARSPEWKSPLLRSAKGDRSTARQHVGS
jgi:hypothetical protein